MSLNVVDGLSAVYAFARTADDFADEPGYDDSERLRLLGEWRAKLHDRSDHSNEFVALHDTIDRFSLPMQLFDDLLDAFVQDVSVTRYETWAAVIDYCRRSANPVGRLVLMLNGYRDEHLYAASDAVCTALQLTNFWQDLAIDWGRGRLYVPAQEYQRTGAVTGSLDQRHLTPAWRDALAACTTRTREMFARGRSVCDGVSGRLRWELRLTWLGGTRILDRLERGGFDVFAARPSLGAADLPPLLWRAMEWRT